MVSDQVTSPTLADDLAEALLAIAKSPSTGIFHTAGATPLSRFDFALRISKKLGLDEKLIQPIDSTQFKQLARRPRNSSLVSNRIRDELGYQMMNIDQELDLFSEQARRMEGGD